MSENWKCQECGELNPLKREKCWLCGAPVALVEPTMSCENNKSGKRKQYVLWGSLSLLVIVCISCIYAPHLWLLGFLKVTRPLLIPIGKELAPLVVSPTSIVTPTPLLVEITTDAVAVYNAPGTDNDLLGTLEPGDTVTVIGSQSICEEEGLDLWYKIQTRRFNQVVWINANAASATPCGSPPVDWEVYIVQSGDTLYRIGKMHDVDPVELARVNCLIEYRIHVDQELYVPTATMIPND